MCDDDGLSLQNILQSVPRRELKIILQRAEYIFPALRDGLVSVFVFVNTEKKKRSCKYVFPESYFCEHFASKLIFLLIYSTSLL
jgi:hypothetical protein